MQRWKKGLFIGLFSSMLLEQQTVAAAVGLNRPDVKGYRVQEAPRKPDAAVAVAIPVPLPDVVATGPLDPGPPMELMTHAQREELRRLDEEARQAELKRQEQEQQNGEPHGQENGQQYGGQSGQQLVLASRGDLPGTSVQNQPEPAAVKPPAESNAAPKLMKQPGVSSATGNAVITLALRYQGVPYQYGGTTPAGFDCSGFIQYVMREAGIELPRTTYEQINAGVQVSRGDLRPGDILFFACGGSATSHAGLYIGNGQFIHADLDSGISIDDLNGPYWGGVYQAAVRVQ